MNLPCVAKWENYSFQKLHFRRGQKFIDRIVKYNFEVSHKFGKRKLTSRPRYIITPKSDDEQKPIDLKLSPGEKIDYFDYDDAFRDDNNNSQLKTLSVEI